MGSGHGKELNLTLKVWRQKNTKATGSFETHQLKGISVDMSFLEMFDVLNEKLIVEGKEAIAFDHDCREGICGMCSMYINGRPHGPKDADASFEAAACIGCGACVAACKNSSAMLFVSAKVSQLALLPQGQVERKARVLKMIAQMDEEGFGNCTNTGACEAECPKGISLENIARMNRELMSASATYAK